jgi:uncharacterized protein YdeI (YjbR/CyaY-like superfamily)
MFDLNRVEVMKRSGMEQNKVHVSSRPKWRAWLQKNHAAMQEVWLVFNKSHTGRKLLTYNDAVEEALCFGWVDSIVRRIDEETYMQKFTPRKPTSSWSPSNKERVTRLMKLGKMTTPGKRIIALAKKNGNWTKPTAATTIFSMPRELEWRLRGNNVAKRNFDGMTASQQRLFISWVASAKREETREKRANEATSLLARNQKLGMK